MTDSVDALTPRERIAYEKVLALHSETVGIANAGSKSVDIRTLLMRLDAILKVWK